MLNAQRAIKTHACCGYAAFLNRLLDSVSVLHSELSEADIPASSACVGATPVQLQFR